MTHYERILSKCKISYLENWSDDEIEEFKARLRCLSRKELLSLFCSRWMSKTNPLFLYLSELIENTNKRTSQYLSSSSNDELLDLLSITKDDYIQEKISEIIYYRYDKLSNNEKERIYKILKT